MAATDPYTIDIYGIPHTVLLDEEEAQRRGLKPQRKVAAPENTAAVPQNKATIPAAKRPRKSEPETGTDA
ncbi:MULTISPECIES: hypothetical protein [Gordonia]|uniref:hypothetical protein n=1 Tax=Gordonia TaxID=2053 RepID=UPI00257F69F9|nr:MULTISPECIES: hypothetical protein [Gordonia]